MSIHSIEIKVCKLACFCAYMFHWNEHTADLRALNEINAPYLLIPVGTFTLLAGNVKIKFKVFVLQFNLKINNS